MMTKMRCLRAVFMLAICGLVMVGFLAMTSWALAATTSATETTTTSSATETTTTPSAKETTTTSGETITVGIPTDRCPIAYIDSSTGEITGIAVDLMRSAAANAGLEVRFVALDEGETLKDALDDERFDVVMPFGSAIESTSGKASIITDSIFDMPMTVVAKQGTELTSIQTMHLGMNRSNAGLAATIQSMYPDCEITFYDDWDTAFDALGAGEVDGLLNNTYVWSYLLQKPDRSRYVVIPVTAITVSMSAGALDTTDNEALIARLDEGVAQVTDAERQSTILSYTSRRLYTDTFADALYKNRMAIVAIAAIILVIVLSFLLALRQRNRYVKRLQTTNAELARANNAETTFLSNMSHDMRTPLNAIIGFDELALKTDDPAESREYLEKINQSGRLMLDLVNDVLDLSKIESGKMEMHDDSFAIRGLFDSILASMSTAAKARDITLTSHVDDDIPRFVCADRLRLEQVGLNLLSNAVKYTPDGGSVDFTVESQPVDEQGCTMVMRISDTGIGISKEFQERMFEPFSQEHQSRAFDTPGTGLGLAIVKRIVELMGGSISVDSALGEGSTFTVKLPLRAIEEGGGLAGGAAADGAYMDGDGADGAAASKTAALAGRHILLVEDNGFNTEIAETILTRSAGAVVECAADGKRGLEMFEASTEGYYDAVLMDLRMPVMDGFAATKAIRALDRVDAADVPIIAMSADAFAEDVSKCMDVGMDAHVSKPVAPDTLISTLAEKISERG